MLSNFQLGSHPLLQTLLLGQPEFRGTLADHPSLEQLRQRVIATHHLEPMQPNEVQQYIEHRMKCVGWQDNPAFDQRVFAEIFSASGGIPRRINQIVNRLLLLGAVDQRTRIDGAMVKNVLDELADDGSFTVVKPEQQKAPEAAPVEEAEAVLEAVPAPEAAPFTAADLPVEPAVAAGPDLSGFEAILAKRDAQIAELQRAVVELSEVAPGLHGPGESSAELFDAINERLSSLEGSMIEQDRTIRHTLTMLIEWVEESEGQRDAA